MRARFLGVVAYLVVPAVMGCHAQTKVIPGQAPPGPTTLCDYVLAERAKRGLPPLAQDPIESPILERYLPQIFEKIRPATAGSCLPIDLSHYIPDWNKAGFLCTGRSTNDIFRTLSCSPSFVRELHNPKYTHVVTGTMTDSSGASVAIVCLIQRTVYFNAFEASVAFEGPTDLTLSGHAPGIVLMRFTFYKGTETPDKYKGDQIMSKEMSPPDDGSFEVTLPMSTFGPGEYRVAVYVKAAGSKALVLSAWIEFTV
jgi:hypothetical protein